MMIEYDDTPRATDTQTYQKLLDEYRTAQRNVNLSQVVLAEAQIREEQTWYRLMEFESKQGKRGN